MAGHHEAAEQMGMKAHREFWENGSRQWVARSLEMLGQSVAATGRVEDARSFYTQALEQYGQFSTLDAGRGPQGPGRSAQPQEGPHPTGPRPACES